MIAEAEVRQLVDDLFEEEALVIGGLVAVRRLDDELVWRLMKSFDIIRSRFLQRIENRDARDNAAASQPDLTPHPAIEDFLLRVRRGQQ